MLRALGSIPSMAKKTYPPNPKKNPTKIKWTMTQKIARN
jgi:hypothetical protein